ARAERAGGGGVINSGHSWLAADRFCVGVSGADGVRAQCAQRMRNLTVGGPLDPATDIGPPVNAGQREEIEGQVQDALAKGAEAVVGGHRLSRPGWFFEPTLLAGVTKEMRVLREETFGPVAPVLRVPDLESGIREANDSEFGLGASLWTRNLDRADEL